MIGVSVSLMADPDFRMCSQQIFITLYHVIVKLERHKEHKPVCQGNSQKVLTCVVALHVGEKNCHSMLHHYLSLITLPLASESS